MRLRRERSANGPSCNKSNNCGNNSNTLPSNRLLKRPLMYVACLPFVIVDSNSYRTIQ